MVTTLLLLKGVSALRDHRDQDIGLPLRADMPCSPAAEERNGAIARIVVQERPAAAELVLEVRKARSGGLAPLVIAAAHGQRETMPRRHHDRRRPELDVERHHFARLEWLQFVVRVIRPVLGRELWIELAVRRAQPARATGVCGSIAPMNTTSRMSGVN